jgi:hypothetical protein
VVLFLIESRIDTSHVNGIECRKRIISIRPGRSGTEWLEIGRWNYYFFLFLFVAGNYKNQTGENENGNQVSHPVENYYGKCKDFLRDSIKIINLLKKYHNFSVHNLKKATVIPIFIGLEYAWFLHN